jgi:hypothetical protein
MPVSFLYCANNIIIKPTPLWPLWYSLPAHSTASPVHFTLHSHSCLMHIAHCTTIIFYQVWLTCSLYSLSARSSAASAHCPGTPARWTARSVCCTTSPSPSRFLLYLLVVQSLFFNWYGNQIMCRTFINLRPAELVVFKNKKKNHFGYE